MKQHSSQYINNQVISAIFKLINTITVKYMHSSHYTKYQAILATFQSINTTIVKQMQHSSHATTKSIQQHSSSFSSIQIPGSNIQVNIQQHSSSTEEQSELQDSNLITDTMHTCNIRVRCVALVSIGSEHHYILQRTKHHCAYYRDSCNVMTSSLKLWKYHWVIS